jgi:hypothetical protein
LVRTSVQVPSNILTQSDAINDLHLSTSPLQAQLLDMLMPHASPQAQQFWKNREVDQHQDLNDLNPDLAPRQTSIENVQTSSHCKSKNET